jgi:hypothetical protein
MPAFSKTWPKTRLSGALVAGALFVGALAVLAPAGVAQAQAKNCGCKPPPPPPPPPCNCTTPPTTVNVTVNTSSSAQSNANAASSAFARTGGGGGAWVEQAPAAGVIQALNVETGETEEKRVAFQEKRRVERRVLVQAVCLDDKGAPHPASQVHPERDVTDSYDGEMFRCIAGARLQATIGDFNDQLTLDKGDTLSCDKQQALYHAPDGAVTCRAQKPARDCNERSLLRRYGPGVKALKLVREETVTSYREEKTARTAQAGGMMTLDGGVGGFH